MKNSKDYEGFEAFGKPVPAHRLTAGYKAVKEMCPKMNTETAFSIVSKCARSIERDMPFEIIGAITTLDNDIGIIDLTGRYRLLATLLAG